MTEILHSVVIIAVDDGGFSLSWMSTALVTALNIKWSTFQSSKHTFLFPSNHVSLVDGEQVFCIRLTLAVRGLEFERRCAVTVPKSA